MTLQSAGMNSTEEITHSSCSCSMPLPKREPKQTQFTSPLPADGYSGPVAAGLEAQLPAYLEQLAAATPFAAELKTNSTSGESCIGLPGYRIMPTAPGPVPAALTIVFPEIRQMDIVYTNDIHGVMGPISTKEGKLEGGMAFVAGKIDELRQEAHGNSLVLDGGDWGQGTMESNMSKGRVMTKIMNAIGYDAMVIGNHEFDWGPANLRSIIDIAKVPLLGANIACSDGTPLNGLSSSIIKTIDGVKVGIVGLIAEETPLNASPDNLKGIQILKIKETAERCIDDLRKAGAELIVVLSHNGDRNDEELAETVKGIDIIVGGHSHTVIDEPREAGNTLIVQAGTQGRQVGQAKLGIRQHLTMDATAHADDYPLSFNVPDSSGDKRTGLADSTPPHSPLNTGASIVSCSNEMIPVTSDQHIRPDGAVEKIMGNALKEVKKKSSRVMGTLDFDLPHDRMKIEESPLGDFLTDAIRAETKCDIAFQTSSGIRDSLYCRPLEYGDLYRIFPFDNVTVTVDLTGEKVRKVLEHSAALDKNYLQVSGISMDIDRKKPEGSRVSAIMVNGEPLEPEKSYRVAVNDLLMTGGFGYEEFAQGRNAKYGKLQRDNLVNYVKKTPHSSTPPSVNRINFSL